VVKWSLVVQTPTVPEGILFATQSSARKDVTMDRDRVQPLGPRRTARQTEPSSHLTTCSLCLRVLRDSEWVEAERVIREIRSYELAALPDLQSAICDACAETIFKRRAQSGQPIAA
jgi:hypothetical protein